MCSENMQKYDSNDQTNNSEMLDDECLEAVSGGVDEGAASISTLVDWATADFAGSIDVADAVLIARFAAEDTEARIY